MSARSISECSKVVYNKSYDFDVELLALSGWRTRQSIFKLPLLKCCWKVGNQLNCWFYDESQGDWSTIGPCWIGLFQAFLVLREIGTNWRWPESRGFKLIRTPKSPIAEIFKMHSKPYGSFRPEGRKFADGKGLMFTAAMPFRLCKWCGD